jgi:hypothetical protein
MILKIPEYQWVDINVFYVYGMGCFLSSFKCLALTQNCTKIVNQWRKCDFESVILTDLVVLNFCTFHLKEKWMTMLPVERRLAVRQARVRILARHPSEDPQLRNSTEENGVGPQHIFVNDCMNGYYTKKCMHSYTKMCLVPRTRVFISKSKKSQEENKFLHQKIKESEDKVDDLKSDFILYNHIGLWWKLKKSVWNICLVLYCLFICPISNNTCLPICSYWMQAPPWPSDKQLLLLSKSFLLDVISNNRYRLQIINFLLGSTFVANCNLKLWVA